LEFARVADGSREAMHRRMLGNLVLAGITTLVLLLLLELGLRLFRPQPLSAVARSARLGWLHKPNASLVYERREFHTAIRFSSVGLRDREYTLGKQPSTWRVAMLGDSFVEAMQVPTDSMISRQLEAALHHVVPDGVRCEVMNFGVSGYGSCQQLVQLEEFVLRYEPDLVVSVYYQNDLDDNARFGLCHSGQSGELWVVEAQELDARTRLLSGIKSFLWQHSHLFVFVATRRLRSEYRTDHDDAGWRRGPLLGGTSVDTCPGRHRTLESLLSIKTWTSEAREAVRLHASILERMRQRCRARGAGFVAVLGVSADQIDSTLTARSLETNGCRPDGHEPTLPNQRLREALEERDIKVVDLLPAFLAVRSSEQLFYQFDGHWGAAGHRVAARALCEALSQRGIPPSHNP
jgi:hypothetical protein